MDKSWKWTNEAFHVVSDQTQKIKIRIKNKEKYAGFILERAMRYKILRKKTWNRENLLGGGAKI